MRFTLLSAAARRMVRLARASQRRYIRRALALGTALLAAALFVPMTTNWLVLLALRASFLSLGLFTLFSGVITVLEALREQLRGLHEGIWLQSSHAWLVTPTRWSLYWLAMSGGCILLLPAYLVVYLAIPGTNQPAIRNVVVAIGLIGAVSLSLLVGLIVLFALAVIVFVLTRAVWRRIVV